MPPADPRPRDPAFEVEAARLLRDYPRWMYTADIATEESCSVETARRHLQDGKLGPIDKPLNGSLRILTAHYLNYLRNRTVIFTGKV